MLKFSNIHNRHNANKRLPGWFKENSHATDICLTPREHEIASSSTGVVNDSEPFQLFRNGFSSLATISEMPEFDLSVMSSYLEEEPDSRLNETAATTKIAPSVKSVFKKRFNIPWIGHCWHWWKWKGTRLHPWILLQICRIPDNVYHALRSEFLFGNNFNTLLPHLMKYFWSNATRGSKFQTFWLHLQGTYSNQRFLQFKLVLGLQKYILNPEILIQTFQIFLLGKWNKLLDMPSLVFYHNTPISCLCVQASLLGFTLQRNIIVKYSKRLNSLLTVLHSQYW